MKIKSFGEVMGEVLNPNNRIKTKPKLSFLKDKVNLKLRMSEEIYYSKIGDDYSLSKNDCLDLSDQIICMIEEQIEK